MEEELCDAQAYHRLRRAASLNAWAAAEARQVDLRERFHEHVAADLARRRRREQERAARFLEFRARRDGWAPPLPPVVDGWGPPRAPGGNPEVVAAPDGQGNEVGVKAPPTQPPAPNHG